MSVFWVLGCGRDGLVLSHYIQEKFNCNTFVIILKPVVNGRKNGYQIEVYRSSASGSASADIRVNFDIRIRIRIRNISCGCHADIANNKRIIF